MVEMLVADDHVSHNGLLHTDVLRPVGWIGGYSRPCLAPTTPLNLVSRTKVPPRPVTAQTKLSNGMSSSWKSLPMKF